MRVSSDMMLVCCEDLQILHHNRAFLKGMGFAEGSFEGGNLLAFFPPEERDEAGEAFAGFQKGHAAGMRLNGNFLTSKGLRPFDLRIVRSRNPRGSFTYYLVARDMARYREVLRRIGGRGDETLVENLPVAVWRTDKDLRVLQASGNLWLKFGVTKEGLVGGDLRDPRCELLPPFLHSLDYSDTFAGMSLQTDLRWNGEDFNVSVEPVLDHADKLIGTLGMVRKAKSFSRGADTARSQAPWHLESATESLGTKSRKVFLDPVLGEGELAEPAFAAKPVIPLLPRRDKSDEASIALAN